MSWGDFFVFNFLLGCFDPDTEGVLALFLTIGLFFILYVSILLGNLYCFRWLAQLVAQSNLWCFRGFVP